jgi:hypothetical protein
MHRSRIRTAAAVELDQEDHPPMEGHPTTEKHERRYDVPVSRQVIPQLSNRLAPDSRVQLRPHRPESRSSFEAPRTTHRYPK